MKKSEIHDPIYEEFFTMVWDCSVTELAAYLEKKWSFQISVEGESLGKFVRIMHHDDTETRYIWVNNKRNTVALAHELMHFTFFVMENLGVPLDVDVSEEVYTKYHSFCMRESLKAMGIKLYES